MANVACDSDCSQANKPKKANATEAGNTREDVIGNQDLVGYQDDELAAHPASPNLDGCGRGTVAQPEVGKATQPPTQRRVSTRQKKIIIKQTPKKTPRNTVWTTERLLTDAKSPLAKADLRSIVANPMAWDILDPGTRAEVLALFPHKHMVLDAGLDTARPDTAAMMNDDTFRGDCASYTENLAQGRHNHDWLTSAYHAHHRRQAGDFDQFQVQQVLDDWGVELPVDFMSRRVAAQSADPRQRGGSEEK